MRQLQITLCLLLSLAATPCLGEVAVIVHPSNTLQLNANEVRQIFLGKTHTFPNGKKAEPFDTEGESNTKVIFTKQVLHKSLSSLNSYWSRMLFSSKGKPPKTFSEDKIKAVVASNKNAIAYIQASAADNSVRVLFTAR